MKTKTRRLLSLLNFCVLTLLACGNSDGAGEDSGVPYLAKKGEPVDGVRIGWDYGTIRQLATREDIHVPSVCRIIQWWLYMRTMILVMKCAVVQMKVVHGGSCYSFPHP